MLAGGPYIGSINNAGRTHKGTYSALCGRSGESDRLAGMLHLPVLPAFPKLRQAVSKVLSQPIFCLNRLGLPLTPPLHLQRLLPTPNPLS